MIGKVRVMSTSNDTTHIRKLIEHLNARGDRIGIEGVVGDLIDRAHGELLELEKDREILVVAGTQGHWAVPFTEGTLKELREAVGSGKSAAYVAQLCKLRKGSELCDEQYHNCSFYSHVVVCK